MSLWNSKKEQKGNEHLRYLALKKRLAPLQRHVSSLLFLPASHPHKILTLGGPSQTF